MWMFSPKNAFVHAIQGLGFRVRGLFGQLEFRVYGGNLAPIRTPQNTVAFGGYWEY